MILVDTNVIISFWRSPTEKLKGIFENNQIAISGVTRAELLHGAKNNTDFIYIEGALNSFEELDVDREIWSQLGKILFKLRRKGIKVPFQDALIATLAIANNCQLWTYDNHYKLILKVIPELELFNDLKNI